MEIDVFSEQNCSKHPCKNWQKIWSGSPSKMPEKLIMRRMVKQRINSDTSSLSKKSFEKVYKIK